MSHRVDGASLIRKGLVVAQFSSAIVLIIAIVVIYTQINHVRNRELGYDLRNVVSVGISEKLVANFDGLKQTLLSEGTATQVGLSTSSILGIYSNGGGFSWPGKDDSQDPLISFIGIDAGFLPLMDVKMAQGRNFRPDIASEGNNILINDALARLMGKEGQAGKKMYRGNESSDIVGVTQPFLFNDLHASDQPVIFYPMSREQIAGWGGNIFVKLDAGNDLADKLKELEAGIRKIDASLPFSYRFLSDDYEAMFKKYPFYRTSGYAFRCFGRIYILPRLIRAFRLHRRQPDQRNRGTESVGGQCSGDFPAPDPKFPPAGRGILCDRIAFGLVFYERLAERL
ncbi:MAG: ABC transporter permease [Leadbetterella sp.]|nr:ABC transporter permease [Leadbetterella sp.]